MIVGIAPSQILLALSLAALLLSGAKLRLPPIKLPLALFLLGTLISIAFSLDPKAGLPQIIKIYVFCQLLVAFSLLRSLRMIGWLFLTWAGLGCLSAIRGFFQFANKLHDAHALGRDFYTYYVSSRITGFMSHWYYFSVEEMFVLLMLGAYLFFAPKAGKEIWLWISFAAVISLGLLLAYTRGVWIATAIACAYLIWFYRPRLLLLAPILAAIIFFLAPPDLHERIRSILRPDPTIDSNAFRVVTSRTGIEMIKAHPFLGLGPEMPRILFNQYVPADIPRPLPEGSYIHLHNIYLHYAAERGIPTLLAFLWLMGRILYDFANGLRRLPPGRGYRRFLLHGGIAVVLATLLEGFVDVNFSISVDLAMILVVISCGYVALEKDAVDT